MKYLAIILVILIIILYFRCNNITKVEEEPVNIQESKPEPVKPESETINSEIPVVFNSLGYWTNYKKPSFINISDSNIDPSIII